MKKIILPSFGPALTRRHFLAASTAATALLSCDDPNSSHTQDAGTDADLDSGPDADLDGASDADADAGQPEPRPVTTVRETIRGRLQELAQLEDLRPVFGLTRKMPGEPWVVRDEWQVAAVSSGAAPSLAGLAYFAQLTDVHILDEESPARAIHSPIAAASAWRPYDAYSLHLLDAAMGTLNGFAAVRPHDFVLFTGDVTDNHLFIELRWFLDIVEGNQVDPDTGADDNPMTSGDVEFAMRTPWEIRQANFQVDPHDPFTPVGLSPQVPWYLCLGNHDAWVLGSLGVSVVASPTGGSATLFVSHAVTPTCFDEVPCPRGYCYAESPVRCHVPMDDGYYTSSSIPADPARRYIDLEEFKSMVMQSRVHGPSGHGFTMENLNDRTHYFSVDEPVPGLPISMIVLDTTTAYGGTDKSVGAIDGAQLGWIEDRLAHYSLQNRAIIVVSHHPADTVADGGGALAALLGAYPHVVLHVVGHGHINRIYPHPPAAGQSAWHGYWEVQTPSTLEWPQQMRFYEIVDHGDGTGAVYVTCVDLAIPEGSVAEAGRFYTLADIQEGRAPAGLEGAVGDRNAVLRFAWPPELVPVLAAMPRRPVESLHFLP